MSHFSSRFVPGLLAAPSGLYYPTILDVDTGTLHYFVEAQNNYAAQNIANYEARRCEHKKAGPDEFEWNEVARPAA